MSDLIKTASLGTEDVKALLPKRPNDSNKGSFGKALIICGSKNMCGCAVLASKGALRSGAGLVKLAFPDVLYTPILSSLQECVFMPLETSGNGAFDLKNEAEILDAASKSDVVLFGCGVGVLPETKALTNALITKNSTPLILDADALNCICGDVSVLKKRNCEILITPHPGEMSRLINKNVASIEKARETVITGFCREYNVTTLLKGHRTLVFENGKQLLVNTTGNSGLAKGGSGDLLSGIIAGLAASGIGGLYEAAAVGAYIHGLTSEILRDELTPYSMLPGDCANALPSAFKAIISAGE